MSLITCPECGRQISDKAAMCIGCGIPMEEIRIMLSSQEVHSVPDHSDEEMIQEPIIAHSQISAETTAISSSKRIKCLNCSSEYSIGEYKCPNCGQTMLALSKDADYQEALLVKQGWKNHKEKNKAQRDSSKKEEPGQLSEADSNPRQDDNNTVICEGIRFELPFIKDWSKRTVKPGENLNTTPHPFTVYSHSHSISYTQSSLDMMIYHIDKQNEQGSTISNMSNYRRTYAYSWFRKKGLDGVRSVASHEITNVFGKCSKGYSIINDDYIDIDGTKSYRLEYTHRFMNDSYFGNQKTDYCHIYIPVPNRNQLTVIEFEYVITMKDDSTNPAADDARKMMNEIIGSIKID